MTKMIAPITAHKRLLFSMFWAPGSSVTDRSQRPTKARMIRRGQASMARAAFAALQNVAAEGRVAAVEEHCHQLPKPRMS